MAVNLSTNIGKLKLQNPVMAASGTFGYAEEFKDFIELKKLGAIVTKTITMRPRPGSRPARTCETPAGMLNSIGLENPGIEVFLKEKLPFLAKIGIPIIVSIASEIENYEYALLCERLDKASGVDAVELNISCPNIKRLARQGFCSGEAKAEARREDLPLISQDPQATYELVSLARKATKKTLITKLSPNVTDIASIACAAEEAGSDAVSLINTLQAMAIDVKSRAPKIAMITGGLSGPAIRPIAIRMVYEVYKKVGIPIIGIGGIIDLFSALEFFIAGACAVSIGTANFINPKTTIEIIQGLKEYLKSNKIKDMKELIGSLAI